MSSLSWGYRTFPIAIAMAVACGASAFGQASAKRAHPVVAGFERIHAVKGDNAGGRLLLNELNCLSCHGPANGQANEIAPRQAPILDGVAGRARPSYLRSFLSDPQSAKPGTTMPHLFAGLPEKEKAQRIEQLVHYLASTGALRHERPDRKLVHAGRELYHRVGCVACHGTRDADAKQDKTLPTSVPLGDLTKKYSIPGLSAFLENPHQARPSGRMPGVLKSKEAREVAHYLLQHIPFAPLPVNLKYAYYEGSWDRLPDFAKLTPAATGEAGGFDITVARRGNDYALVFEGFLRIPRDGNYRFHLTSDDGSRLVIDGKKVVDNDGVHPPSTAAGNIKLKMGTYPLLAAMFNAGGGAELSIDIEGPTLGRQPLAPFVYMTREGNPATKQAAATPDDIRVDPSLAAQGRELFITVGCASCHQLGNDQKANRLTATPLAKLKSASGCLAESPKAGLPVYSFNAAQRSALAQVIAERPAQERNEANIARTLATFNCYACHERDKIGGMEEAWNGHFTTTQKEMGDEGRIPPTLTGVGAKMTPAYLRKIMAEGSTDRPYMHTRMPRFGEANAGHLVKAFADADMAEAVAKPDFKVTVSKVKSAGRHMVGGLAFGCVKCHTFAGHKAEGVQGIDMALLTQRLQRDWFHRYLLDPQKIRPGTRMPAAWPMGQSTLSDILEGNAGQQIEAIWVYLSDGAKANLPIGTSQHFIPLVPDKEAIVYRNFVEGAGTRAIAVGYPEKTHLAFDANDLRLAMIWQGAFIDAARHWTDRGAGQQPPLGDNVVHLPRGVAFAVLANDKYAWPDKGGRELGYKFLGYRLSADQRPTFKYAINGVTVEDFPNAVAGKMNPGVRRQLKLTAAAPVKDLYFRAAVANKIEPAGDGWFTINGEWRMRLIGNAIPIIRQASGQKELLVPVQFEKGRAEIRQEFAW